MRIEKKPRVPGSKYAVTGIYMFDEGVFEYCRSLRPSERGELGITDVLSAYTEDGDLHYDILEGWWTAIVSQKDRANKPFSALR